MFIEKIDDQLLEEIQEELDEEYNELVGNWEDEFYDLNADNFEDALRSQIFEHYNQIPLSLLADEIEEHFPFLNEKEISIIPHSEIVYSESDDSIRVDLRVYADVFDSDRDLLNESESTQLDILLEELTQLYEELEFTPTLSITHVPIEEVPEDCYHQDEDGQDFVQITF